MRYFILLLLASMPVNAALADDPDRSLIDEKWQCFDISDYNKRTVLIELERFKPLGELFGSSTDSSIALGKVIAAGQSNDAYFTIEGLNRRWDWPTGGDKGLKYTFVIQPDGSAAYYDFTKVEDGGTTSPSQVYECVLTKG